MRKLEEKTRKSLLNNDILFKKFIFYYELTEWRSMWLGLNKSSVFCSGIELRRD